MGNASRRLELAAKLLVAAVSMAGTVAAIEWGARSLRLDTGFFLLPSDANCLHRTGSLSMEFRSRCVGELAETHFVTNALGFRSPELRDDGSERILAIGDSCTWGWHVDQDEAYPAALQRLLDQQFPGRYQVINAGVPGYTSYQVLVALREKGLPLRPSIVILSAGFNDLFEAGDVETQIASERRLMPVLLLDDFLLDHSTSYRWTRWKTAGGGTPTGAKRVSPAGYARNMRVMIDAAREQGAHVLVLSFWHPGGKDRTYPDALTATVDAARAPLVTYDGPRIDVVHPTAEGDRTLAAEIDKTLRAEGWVR